MHARLDQSITSLEERLQGETAVRNPLSRLFIIAVLFLSYTTRGALHAVDLLFTSPQRSFAKQVALDESVGYTQSYTQHRSWHYSVRFGTVSYGLVLALGIGLVTTFLQITNQARFATPAYAATLTVNVTDDTDDTQCSPGHCSLREAINDANTNPGLDIINIDGAIGPIELTGALPAITEEVVINGNTRELDCNSLAISGLTLDTANITVNNFTVRDCGGPAIFITTNAYGFDLNSVNGMTSGTGLSISASPDIGGTVDFGNFENNTNEGLLVSGRSGIEINDARFENNGTYGISTQNVGNTIIRRNEIVGNTSTGLFMAGGTNNTVHANHIGIYSGLVFTNGNGLRGAEFSNESGLTVTDNVVQANTGDGILTNGGGGHTYGKNLIKAHNNRGLAIVNTSGAQVGLDLVGAGHGNILENNGVGLHIAGSSDNVSYRGNQFVNNTTPTDVDNTANGGHEFGVVTTFTDTEITGATAGNARVDFYSYTEGTNTFLPVGSVVANGAGQYTYSADLSSVDRIGAVSTSGVNSAQLRVLDKAGEQPITVAISAITSDSAQLDFSVNTTVSGSIVYHPVDNPADTRTLNGPVDGTFFPFFLNSLQSATTYSYTFTAIAPGTNLQAQLSGEFTTIDGTDNQAPGISDTTVIPTDTSALIQWNTNEPATGTVNYGITDALGTSKSEGAGFVTNHSINLTGLTPDTEYFYTHTSADSDGNVSTTPINTFRTVTPDELFANQVTVIDSNTKQVVTGSNDKTIVVQKEGGVIFQYQDTTGKYKNNNYKMQFVVDQLDQATQQKEKEILNKEKAFNSNNKAKVKMKASQLKLKDEYQLRTQLIDGNGGGIGAVKKRFNFTVTQSIGEFMSPAAPVTQGVPQFMFVTTEPTIHFSVRNLAGEEVVGCDAVTTEGIATCLMPYLPAAGEYAVFAVGANGQSATPWFNSLPARDTFVLDDRSADYNARLTYSKNPQFTNITAAERVELFLDGTGPIIPTVETGSEGQVRGWNYTHSLFDVPVGEHTMRVVEYNANGKVIGNNTFKFMRIPKPVIPAIIAPTQDTFTSIDVILQVIGHDNLYAAVNGNVFFEGNFVDGGRQLDLSQVLLGRGTYTIDVWSRNKYNVESAHAKKTVNIVAPRITAPVVVEPQIVQDVVETTTSETPQESSTDTTEELPTDTTQESPVVALENVDTNGDGLGDGIEELVEQLASEAIGTSEVDTDGDGLSDILEQQLGSDPTNSDSDNDGISDAVDAKPTPLPQFTDIVALEMAAASAATENYEETGSEQPIEYAPVTQRLVAVSEEQEVVLQEELSEQVAFSANFTVEPDANTVVSEEDVPVITITNEITPDQLWDWLRGNNTSNTDTTVTLNGNLDVTPVDGLPLLLQNSPHMLIGTIFSSPTVKIAMAEDPDGAWTMEVPAELLEEGEHVAYAVGEVNGTRGDNVEVARFVLKEETTLSNTTWLLIIVAGMVVVGIAGVSVVQLSKQNRNTGKAVAS